MEEEIFFFFFSPIDQERKKKIYIELFFFFFCSHLKLKKHMVAKYNIYSKDYKRRRRLN